MAGKLFGFTLLGLIIRICVWYPRRNAAARDSEYYLLPTKIVRVQCYL